MSPKSPKRKKPAAPPRGPRFRWPVAVIFAIGATAVAWSWPNAHGWHSLGPGLGRLRWAETVSSFTIEPPLAPEWIRRLHDKGLPWPTDQPLKSLGAGFGAQGGGEQAAAWYVIQSDGASNELWSLDKRSVRLTDAVGKTTPWPGGSGAALIDPDRRLQYLYLGVPRDLAGKEARLRFRVVRFEGPGRGLTS